MDNEEIILASVVLIGGVLMIRNMDGESLSFGAISDFADRVRISPTVAPGRATAERLAEPEVSGPPTFEQMKASATEREVVARTIWAEARDQGGSGMAAVAHVIRNRAVVGRYGGGRPRGVALAPFQFSVWNEDSRNRRASLAVTTADAQYREALKIYDAVIGAGDDRQVPPNVRGATHYYVTNSPTPFWASKINALGSHGAHSFFLEV